MNPKDLIKTIYLGDRGCKGVLIDTWNKSVSLHVTVISRIRSQTGRWEYYDAEDIVDGRIVFTDVERFSMSPPGPIPNDFINEISATEQHDVTSGRTHYAVRISISSVDAAGLWTEVIVELDAGGMHLEAPDHPGVAITT